MKERREGERREEETHSPRHDHHQFLRRRQILRRPPPDQLLKLCRLRLAVFFFEFVGRLERLGGIEDGGGAAVEVGETVAWSRGGSFSQDSREGGEGREEKKRTLVAQQPMHVPNMYQILLMLTRHANRMLPLMHQFQDLLHRRRREGWRSLRETTDEFVEEFFRADLEVEGVAAVFDEDVEELESSVFVSSILDCAGRGEKQRGERT
jgi:hypothetical protein